MAAPTAPTLTRIVAEGLAKAGEASPASALTTRAEDKYMQEIKNDIWLKCKTLKSLQKINGIVFNKGQSVYSMPSDFAGQGEVSIKILDGANTGTLQTAGASSATLASSFSATEDFMIGKELLITSGTGVNETGQITAWNNSTKVATVAASWGTTPVTGDGYLVVETYKPLDEGPVWNYDRDLSTMSKRKPSAFHPTGDVDYSEIVLDAPPDKAYGGIIRYYVNIMTVDLASTLMSTLYQKYQNLFTQGVKVKRLEDNDDDRAPRENQIYMGLLQAMVAAESYGNSLSQLQARVCD